MKKALIFALSAVLTLGTAAPVLAYNGEDYYPENDYVYDYYNDDYNGYEDDYNDYEDDYNGYGNGNGLPALPPAIGKVGYIDDYDYENNQLTVSCEFDYENVIVFNLNEGTVIIDAVTGEPAVIADRTGDRVKVYHAVFMTMSMPPQSPAYVVAINVPEYGMGPHFHVIEAIDNEDEDTLLLTVSTGGLIITLEREAPLNPHLTRQMVSLEHLNVGDTLLFWYNMVAASYPGQTTATRALWLRSGETATQDEEDYYNYEDYDYSDNDYHETEQYPQIQPPKNIAQPGTGVMRNGVEFFPVRALAVEEGYNVSWDSATSSAILTMGQTIISVANNAKVYYVNGTGNSLSAAVFIENGVMYAPYSFFYVFS